jgi:hypothetical protein
MGPIVGALGVVFVGLGAWAGGHSGSFTDVLADFGPQNDHLVHDFGAASVAIGAALLIAALEPSWRTPILAVAALWNGLHTVSHVVDLGEAASTAVAVTEVLLLAGATALLTALAWSARTTRATA